MLLRACHWGHRGAARNPIARASKVPPLSNARVLTRHSEHIAVGPSFAVASTSFFSSRAGVPASGDGPARTARLTDLLQVAARNAAAGGFVLNNGYLDAYSLGHYLGRLALSLPRPDSTKPIVEWYAEAGLESAVEFASVPVGPVTKEFVNVKGMPALAAPAITPEARKQFLHFLHDVIAGPFATAEFVKDGQLVLTTHFIRTAFHVAESKRPTIINPLYWLQDPLTRAHLREQWFANSNEFRGGELEHYIGLTPQARARVEAEKASGDAGKAIPTGRIVEVTPSEFVRKLTAYLDDLPASMRDAEGWVALTLQSFVFRERVHGIEKLTECFQHPEVRPFLEIKRGGGHDRPYCLRPYRSKSLPAGTSTSTSKASPTTPLPELLERAAREAAAEGFILPGSGFVSVNALVMRLQSLTNLPKVREDDRSYAAYQEWFAEAGLSSFIEFQARNAGSTAPLRVRVKALPTLQGPEITPEARRAFLSLMRVLENEPDGDSESQAALGGWVSFTALHKALHHSQDPRLAIKSLDYWLGDEEVRHNLQHGRIGDNDYLSLTKSAVAALGPDEGKGASPLTAAMVEVSPEEFVKQLTATLEGVPPAMRDDEGWVSSGVIPSFRIRLPGQPVFVDCVHSEAVLPFFEVKKGGPGNFLFLRPFKGGSASTAEAGAPKQSQAAAPAEVALSRETAILLDLLKKAARRTAEEGFILPNGRLIANSVVGRLRKMAHLPRQTNPDDPKTWFTQVGLAPFLEFFEPETAGKGATLLTVKGLEGLKEPVMKKEEKRAFLGLIGAALSRQLPLEVVDFAGERRPLEIREGQWLSVSSLAKLLEASQDPLLQIKNPQFWLKKPEVMRHTRTKRFPDRKLFVSLSTIVPRVPPANPVADKRAPIGGKSS